MKLLARDSNAERWLAVVLRSVHLAAVVWLGAVVMGAPLSGAVPGPLVLASGTVMLVMDLRAGRIALKELAGAAVLAKLALVVWMLADPRVAAWLFWLLVLGSSVTSHAPKHVRHWPKALRPAGQHKSRPD